MTDLQCPATAVLLEDQLPPPQWLGRLPVAGSFTASESDTVDALIEDSADLFRGETFVVRAPSVDLLRALRRHGLPAALPALLEVDSGGWRRVPLPQ